MSYRSYRAGVERQKLALEAELSQVNDLRRASHLPLWEIEAELERQHPLLSKEAWSTQQQERRAFASFRRERLAGEMTLTPPADADWEQVRALSLRRAYLEYQIERAWLARGTPRQA